MSDTTERYQVGLGPEGGEIAHVALVTATCEQDACYRAGTAAIMASGIGLEAAGWVVLRCTSESQHMDDLGMPLSRPYVHQDEPQPRLRRAHVGVIRSKSIEDMARTVRQYLPRGYQVVGSRYVDSLPVLVVEGRDNAGWTLDGYVIPRLGSGLISAHEVPVIEASEADMPAEPFEGHAYVHASGDCSCV